ncbi:hypothetical protein ABZP36_011981 [Zizania latifolia]
MKLEALDDSRRRILGQNLEGCSIEELRGLEIKIEKSLHNIRHKKTDLLENQIAKLKEKERTLLRDNEDLRKKVQHCSLEAAMPVNRMTLVWQPRDVAAPSSSNADESVETELYIGLPGTERSSNRKKTG